jgi:hypothetical protein
VVVVRIDEHDVGLRAVQLAGRTETGEAATEYQDPRSITARLWRRCSPKHHDRLAVSATWGNHPVWMK